MRDLGVLITEIKKIIPEDQTELIHDLDGILNSLGYSPPESIMIWWTETLLVLSSIGDYRQFIDGSWQSRVYKKWMDIN